MWPPRSQVQAKPTKRCAPWPGSSRNTAPAARRRAEASNRCCSPELRRQANLWVATLRPSELFPGRRRSTPSRQASSRSRRQIRADCLPESGGIRCGVAHHGSPQGTLGRNLFKGFGATQLTSPSAASSLRGAAVCPRGPRDDNPPVSRSRRFLDLRVARGLGLFSFRPVCARSQFSVGFCSM